MSGVVPAAATDPGAAMSELLLQRSVERFLHLEAELLDDRRHRDWLALLADDIVYQAPVRTSRRSDGRVDERHMYWFDDNRASLELRVRRMETDVNWAEEPPSRTRRLVTNVRIRGGPGPDLVLVRSNLLCTRNRGSGPRWT
jgi:PAH dioxygenase small subunit